MSLEDKVCVGCEGFERYKEAEQEYLNASQEVVVSVQQTNGGVARYHVPRDSALSPSRQKSIELAREKVEDEVVLDLSEPLRCAEQCDFICRAAGVILPQTQDETAYHGPEARQVFYAALDVVNEQYIRETYR